MRSDLALLGLALLALGCDSASGSDDAGPPRLLDANVRLMDGGPPLPGTDAGPSPTTPDASRLDASTGTPPGAVGAASVFFVGHSLINHDMPAMLDGIAASAGVTHEYDSHIGVGASLSWIWSHPQGGEGPDPQIALPTGAYDVLVLTEAIPLADQVMWNDTAGYAERFYDLAMAGDGSSRVYLYETWHSLDEPGDWRARLDSDRALWEQIVDSVNAASSGPDMLLVPGGTAMGRLVDRIESGGAPGLSSRRDLFVDDIHLSDVGNYFIALVQYATIYRRSPVGVTTSTVDRWGNPFTAPSASLARVMQEVAWEVVSTDPRAGVMP